MTELRTEFERIQMQYMTGVLADAPAIDARHSSAQELRDILAFYKTPAWQKSPQVMPQPTAEVFQMVVRKMQDLQAQTMGALNGVLRQRLSPTDLN